MTDERLKQLMEQAGMTNSISLYGALQQAENEGFQAGAASRDAEVAELVGVLGNVTVHLVAAHSLLSRGGKKAAASDTILKIMLQDYEKSFEAGRKALAKVRKP